MTDKGWFSGGFNLSDAWKTQEHIRPQFYRAVWPGVVISALLLAGAGYGIFSLIEIAAEQEIGVGAAALQSWVTAPTVVSLIAGQVLFIALLGSIRPLIFDEASFEAHTFSGVLKDAVGRSWPAFVAFLVLWIVDIVTFFAPGLSVVLVGPFLYVAVTRPEASWTDRLRTGWAWTKRHLLTIVSILVVICIFLFVAALGATNAAALLADSSGETPNGWFTLVATVFFTASWAFTFILMSSLFTYIDAEENDLELQDDKAGAHEDYEELLSES